MKNNEYTHNGSFWKSIGLCLRGLLSVAAFTLLWASVIYFNIEKNGWILAGGVAVFTAVFIFNLVLPVIRNIRN